MHIVKQIIFAVFLVAAVQSPVALAQQKAALGNPILVKSVVETDIEVKTAQGTEKKRVPVEKAAPGAEVIYTTTFTNQGSKPAGDVAVTNPIPANTSYVAGSASGDSTVITYSVDGGKTYAAADRLTVKTPEGRERSALPSDYTHIRWTWQGQLASGKTGTAVFRAVIK